LRQNILNFDLENYQERVEKFWKEKGCIEDGHASERVVDLIEQIMKGEKTND
jgi:CDP-glycerol glycerophosphotransferase